VSSALLGGRCQARRRWFRLTLQASGRLVPCLAVDLSSGSPAPAWPTRLAWSEACPLSRR